MVQSSPEGGIASRWTPGAAPHRSGPETRLAVVSGEPGQGHAGDEDEGSGQQHQDELLHVIPLSVWIRRDGLDSPVTEGKGPKLRVLAHPFFEPHVGRPRERAALCPPPARPCPRRAPALVATGSERG